MNKQYFYLVVAKYDEETYPLKIFLQEHQAIKWGRKEASKVLEDTQDYNYNYALYRQEIATTSRLEYVKSLDPYQVKQKY